MRQTLPCIMLRRVRQTAQVTYICVVCRTQVEFAEGFRQCGDMLSPEAFGEVVRSRRRELDLTALQVSQRGGPSDTTLSKIENAWPKPPSAATLRKLDVGLMWPRGRARQILEEEAFPMSAGEAAWRERMERMAVPDGIERYTETELAAELLRRLQARGRDETSEGPISRAGVSPANEGAANDLDVIRKTDPAAADAIELDMQVRRKSAKSDV